MLKHILVSLIFILPILAQNSKTITGTIQNTQGKLWNGVSVELYDGNALLGSTISTNGLFTFDNVLTSTRETDYIPNQFTLYQNYPNPFNPSTIISYHLPNRTMVSLKVYDILGKEVKTLVNAEQSSGDHSVSWNGTNNSSQGVSAGVYFYRLTANDFVKTKKMILTDGAPSQRGTSNFYTASTIMKVSADGYYLKFTGDSIMTKIEEDIDLSGQGDINLGVIEVPGRPKVTGFVYDLDDKYDEDNNRIKPIPGLEGKKVYFGSDTSRMTYTDSNGRFSLMADTIKTDSVFIVNGGDSTHYNWRRTFELQPDEQELTAFNDTTGIPLFNRFTELETGRDLLNVIVHHTDIKNKHVGEVWDSTTTRVRDEDLPIKTYMNRDIVPNDWYADSAWSGLKAVETGRFQFQETPDSNKALLVYKYDHIYVGQGKNIQGEFDDYGPYYTHYEVWLRGPPSSDTLRPRGVVSFVSSHEVLHIAFAGGEHSRYEQDVFYLDPLSRYADGYPLASSEIEKLAIKTIWDLERNPKLLHYFK